ncbi:pentatricopeptide repeat-containing family protein [Populus alba x Populus x berolinensis]|nr:pentatricopeptide repeat-containing family protein [Populus alba x Populus x berolinensis]
MISQWMSDERGYDQSTGVFAVRLDLISTVHGMEQVLGKRFQIVLGVSRFMGSLTKSLGLGKKDCSGMELPPSSWDHLVTGYLVGGEMVKAVETLKKAISISKPGWKPKFYALTACLRVKKADKPPLCCWLDSSSSVNGALGENLRYGHELGVFQVLNPVFVQLYC